MGDTRSMNMTFKYQFSVVIDRGPLQVACELGRLAIIVFVKTYSAFFDIRCIAIILLSEFLIYKSIMLPATQLSCLTSRSNINLILPTLYRYTNASDSKYLPLLPST